MGKIPMIIGYSPVPDRNRFFSELDRGIFAAKENGTMLALLIIHLNHLREINNEFGYETADQLLQDLSASIDNILQTGDFSIRTGDKEFAVILHQLHGIGQSIIVANRILDICKNPMNVNGKLIKIKLAIGISIFPDHADNALESYMRADIAVIHAKRSPDAYMIFSDVPDYVNSTRYIMRTELEEATHDNQLEFVYQPKIWIKDQTISGFEVLARWTSTSLGIVQPDTFINLAEATGLITPLTVKAITIALRQCRDILNTDSNLTIALNISAQILNDPDITDQVLNTINIWCSNPSQLILEITESEIMSNPETILEKLNDMHETGIRISIDDFGTGYSSLSYLKKLPIDEIKIDKSFVQNLNEDADNRNIVQTIIDLANNFNLNTVAEGVESKEILDELEKMGCSIAQGFYISRPVPRDELTEWIKNWNKREPG